MRRVLLGCWLCVCCLQPVWASCWLQAGRYFDIDPTLLYAIGEQESGFNPKAINRNHDGSYDIGIMQINSRHLPRLKRFGITQQVLLEDVCISTMVGASILADAIQQFGRTWEAVGAYNAGGAPSREKIRQRYAKQVWHRYLQLKQRAVKIVDEKPQGLRIKFMD